MTKLEATSAFVGAIARPFSIIVTSASAAVTPAVIVWRIAPDRFDLIGAAAFIGALYAGVGALYWGKAWEVTKVGQHTAEVEKAKATATPPPGTATITAAADVDVQVRDATDPDPAMFGGPRS